MKLPRYLQIALLITAGAVAWSQFSNTDSASAISQTTPAGTPRPVNAMEQPVSTPRPERTNLFPPPKVNIAEAPEIAVTHAEPEPTTPDLPLHALGAWWSHHQRVIVLTDGVETWPVCRRCNASGKIWLGDEPVSGWTLKAVEQDHLLFEWRFTHAQRRLELGELQSEPTK